MTDILDVAGDLDRQADDIFGPDLAPGVSSQIERKPSQPETVSPTLELTGGPTCEQCRQPFTPRTRSGGKPQRFCSPDCRKARHAGATVQVTQQKPTAEDVAETVQRMIAAARPQPDFDWDGDDEKDSICIRGQYAIATYWNPGGHLVIRQESFQMDEDHFVWVRPEYLPSLIRALQAEYDTWRQDHAEAAGRAK